MANAESYAFGVTAYSYDLGDRLTALTPPAGQAAAATYTLDALGRIGSRTISGTTDTYAYLGTSETVSRISTGGANTDALLGADGSRYATKTASGFGWLLSDLHGSVAGASSSSLATISDALRYDAWGQVTASVTSTLPTPWRYQGRLLVDPAGANDLYDAGARFYSPGLGVFTQLDTVQGSTLDPLSLNRYLYAAADPETLVDPDGHVGFIPPPNWFGSGASDPLNQFLGGFVGGLWDFGAGTVGGVVGTGFAAVGCLRSDACVAGAAGGVAQAVGGGVADFARDPGAWDRSTSAALRGAVGSSLLAASDWVGRESDALQSGDPRRIGHAVADVTVAAATVVSVAAAARGLLGAGARAAAAEARWDGALSDASKAAFKAADRADDFTVPLKHQPGARGGQGVFAEGVDQTATIREALRSPDAMFRPNNRPLSVRVTTDLGYKVGSRGQTSVRVVVGLNGKIWTAFPVRRI